MVEGLVLSSNKISPLLRRLWLHVTKRRRKQLGIVFILMLIASVAEVISIGAVVPFLGVLSNPEVVFESELAQPLLRLMEIKTPTQLLIPLSVLFAIAALFAGFMRIVLLWGQTRLAHAVGADISYQIYMRTLYQSYDVHAARNSSEVIAGISVKANQVVGAAILPVLTVLSSVMMIAAILSALISLHPKVTLLTIVAFMLIYGVFIYLTKSRLQKNSLIISEKSNLTIKILQEGLGGIRDVLIDGVQLVYCKAFQKADVVRRRATANNHIMAHTPRYGVEALGMVLIAGLAVLLVGTGDGLVSALPLLGALAVAAQRMLPMMQQAYSSWSGLKGAQAILVDALDLLEQPLPKYAEGPTDKSLPFFSLIKLSNLGFTYHADCMQVLKGLNLEIQKGSRVGFIGTTGSGKSTLLDLIMALLQPTEGTMMVDDCVISAENHRGWQSHIAHIPQTIFLSDSTISENIAFGLHAEKIDMERVRKAAKQAQIDETIMTWDKQYQTMVGERGIRLSGGQRQRIGIARALYKEADVLIFDEATSALDTATEKAVMNEIDKISDEITVLIVAHRLTTLKSCDRIIELENGSIKREGSYSEIVGM